MTTYGQVEKRIARALDAYPKLRSMTKQVYQRLVYLMNRRADFDKELRDGIDLLTPYEWSGAAAIDNPSFVGYYDVTPWSPSGRRYFTHVVRTKDELEVRVFDRKLSSAVTVGRSSTWNFQQGCRAQWLPSNDGPDTILFNDRHEDLFVTRIVELGYGELREVSRINWPVQVVRPGGSEFLSLNYSRLARHRPDYGYKGRCANFDARESQSADGLWRVSTENGEAELLVSLDTLAAKVPSTGGHRTQVDHWVNHAIYSPNGNRFIFLHRWKGTQRRRSRLFSANADGSGLRLLLDGGLVSHCTWLDDNRVLAWARTEEEGDHFYCVNVSDGITKPVENEELERFGDGHPSVSPDGRLIVVDSYPDKARIRHLLLFNVMTESVTHLGGFLAPWAFDGPSRCDLHPRWGRSGRVVSIDSAHTGVRRNYILNLGRLLPNE